VTDHFYTERSVRLPHTYWCYVPPANCPPVGSLPCAASAGHVTFGCLNNFAKVSEPALRTWAAILRQTPRARLILHAPLGRARQRASDLMKSEQVDPGRIEFIGRQTALEYLATYARIDIALDPFPYHGGTTTCDALWMGVPVVTLAGATHAGRVGASLLGAVGLAELIVGDREAYVATAVELARDRGRRAALRAGLRQRLANSPLMDGAGYARRLESAYRAMWRAWCGGRR
jgi:predicted O-linked N-acetylglucosamine transferase (SPINDLY family)